MKRGQVVRSLWDRVWSKVALPEGLSFWAAYLREDQRACWPWTGARSKKRSRRRGVQYYRPVVQMAGRGSKVVNVARLVCEWYQGPPPTPEHEAGHTCPEG